ncbi:MAG: CPBP family intramembrane metalloprotease [Planctomycetota bacterium]|nr:MAG: CPBP family intramembrane metalloprotease [Planctomycetota bacterium]
MVNKHKYNTSQLFNFSKESYLERTSRPIYAIVFLLPFIVFYEIGTILINTDVLNQAQVRVVAFVWLQNFLEYIGFGSKLAWATPPLAVVVALVGMQLVSRKRWHFGFSDIWPMAVECILLAVPLIVLSFFLSSPRTVGIGAVQFNGNPMWIQVEAEADSSAVAGGGSEAIEAEGGGAGRGLLLADIVTGIGAGIYEELVFRLILICFLMFVFEDSLGFSRRNSIVISVLISAALFSAHHHIDFFTGRLNQRDLFSWAKFGFRTIAGIYFAVLFAIRGFGITAGTHAFYDIIATIINALFFPGGEKLAGWFFVS